MFYYCKLQKYSFIEMLPKMLRKDRLLIAFALCYILTKQLWGSHFLSEQLTTSKAEVKNTFVGIPNIALGCNFNEGARGTEHSRGCDADLW